MNENGLNLGIFVALKVSRIIALCTQLYFPWKHTQISWEDLMAIMVGSSELQCLTMEDLWRPRNSLLVSCQASSLLAPSSYSSALLINSRTTFFFSLLDILMSSKKAVQMHSVFGMFIADNTCRYIWFCYPLLAGPDITLQFF